jgi:hypothetical protein
MLVAFNLGKTINEALTGFLLLLDSLVYWVIGLLYDLYASLAGAEIINNSVYEEIANRLLVILGVCMLFYLAYALLKAIVNPDELKNTYKIVSNLVTSLILIAVVPALFNYAFSVQNIIIEEHVIDNVVFGNSNNSIASVGKETAMTFFEAFIDIENDVSFDDYDNWEHLKSCILDPEQKDGKHSCSNESFRDITLLKEPIANGDISYTPIISTICGLFLAYVIASFCIDLGLRVVKLAFYQIISPIPIMMRIIPEKKSVFDNWLKSTMATYMEVFIRLFIMYIIVFLCSKILASDALDLSGVGVFGKIIIILGLFTFGKQAPKLIGDVIGINSGNLKLGIKDKLTSTPILGKQINKAYGTANKIKGAATGALGAGYSSWVNGGKFGAGAKYGAASGWKSGGSQFNNQRNDIYNKMGYKGKAGFFGKQAFMDKTLDDARNSYSDYYKDKVLSKKVQTEEDLTKDSRFTEIYNEEMAKVKKAHNYDDKKANYDALVSNRDESVKKVEAERKEAKNQFESQRVLSLAGYKRKINDLDNKARGMQPGSVDFINTMNEAGKYREEYEKTEASKFDETIYDNKIKQIDKNIEDAKAELAYFEDETAHPYKKYNEKGEIKDYTMSEAKAEALKNARSQMQDESPTYKNNYKVYKARIDEKEITSYKTSLEGQKTIAAYTEAINNVKKANGDLGIPGGAPGGNVGKPGGAGGGPKGNPGGGPKGGK